MSSPHSEQHEPTEGEAPEGHGPHDRFRFLAHQFDEPAAQHEAGKFGIWLFLVAELLLFSGVFVAYGFYRSLHPEVFHWAHYFLNPKLAGLATVLLLGSSLAAAWSVRAAQLGHQRSLVASIGATVLCALAFLALQGTACSQQARQGLVPGARFAPTAEVWETTRFQEKHPAAAAAAARLKDEGLRAANNKTKGKAAAAPVPSPLASLSGHEALPLLRAGVYGNAAEPSPLPSRPRGAQAFFGLYSFLIGLHGLHLLLGIILWVWVLLRAKNQEFSPANYGAVNGVSLYWQLMSLVWVFQFPLLYLIH